MILETIKKHLPDSVKYKLKVVQNNVHYEILDLPPRRSLRTERLLVKAGLLQQRCGSCKNFNYEKGQAIFASNATFRRVATALSPGQLVKIEESDVKPDPDCPHEVAVDKKPLISDPTVFDPPQATNQWNDLGFCQKYQCGEFRFKNFVLDESKNKIPCPSWR